MGGRGVRMTTEISVNEWVEMYSWSDKYILYRSGWSLSKKSLECCRQSQGSNRGREMNRREEEN